MADTKCKTCRRAGEKLFLKGERCFSPKCALVRKPYAPGIHGGKKGGRKPRQSEYGAQLQEKQKMRHAYGVMERQFETYVEKAMESKSDVLGTLVSSLERRLDNVVFRLGFAVSRSLAAQMVSHGHVYVNGKRVTIASYRADDGDVVTLGTTAREGALGKHLDALLKKHKAPLWLELNVEKQTGTVVGSPSVPDVGTSYNLKAIIEYYSR
ncbi:MAG: 30S ribosomal protein S4 [Patescibacteria group bacterium]